MFQGRFANWLDGKPLVVTNWDDSRTNTILNTFKLQIAEDGSVSSTIIEVHYKQHGTNKCTAGYRKGTEYILGWRKIACDKAFNATYVCQKHKSMSYTPLHLAINPLNRTCDVDWIFIENVEYCYLFLKTTSAISFIQAQKACSEEKGSVLSSIKYDERIYSHKHAHPYNQYMLATFGELYFGKYKRIIDKRITGEHVNRMLYGWLLEKAENRLAMVLTYSLSLGPQNNQPLDSIKIFAFMESYCGIIEYKRIYNDPEILWNVPEIYLKNWGAKYRSCRQLINVDALVCEKPSIPYSTMKCAEHFFVCTDSTCILRAYICDNVPDCFDDSDESNCDVSAEYYTNSVVQQSIHIPCHLSNECIWYTNQSVILIQSVCDGIYSKLVLIDEESVCPHIQILKLKLTAMTSSLKGYTLYNTYYNADPLDKYLNEVAVNSKERAPDISSSSANVKHKHERRRVLCRYGGEGVYIHQRCRVKTVSSLPCNYGFTKPICEFILCPGMFKCRQYYCIEVSSVCDGQRDCLYGDDEQNCQTLFCPGQLKCRGEKRCVSSSEICDGHVDCLYSPDDEVTCNACLDDCTCEGYMVFCANFSTDNFTSTPDLVYSKGLILSGIVQSFMIDNEHLKYLIYLSISSCSLRNMNLYPQNIGLSSEPYLMFLNLSNNQLSSLTFLSDHFFAVILSIDISQNSISYIKRSIIGLNNITILYVSDNPIYEINSEMMWWNLKLVVLKNVYYNTHVTIDLPDHCDVIVTDSDICCILSNTITCKSDYIKRGCYGLFEYISTKCIFYILTLVSILMYFANLFKIGKDKNWKVRNKKYHFISQFNYTLADLLSLFYLMVLFITDITEVNIILWKQGRVCIFLKALIGTTIYSSLIFKTLSIIIVVLKIVYPFKHQLRWLRIIPIVSVLIWIFEMCVHLCLFVADKINQEKGIYSDTFCTFLNCHDTFKFTLFLSVIFDIFSLVVFLLAQIKAFNHLSENKKDMANISTQTIDVANITLKIARPFSFEVFFRFFMISVFTCKSLTTSCPIFFCFSFFLYLLPANILISCLLNMI